MNSDIIDILTSHFVANALIGGLMLSVCAGLLGYFIVLRKMTFAAHALSHIGIPGATGAILLGISPIFGLVGFCFVGGLILAFSSKASSKREISTGTILAASLALGILFSSLSTKAAKGMQAVLFGSINLISDNTLLIFAVFSLVIIVLFIAFYKKLLFTSINPEIAEAKGVNLQLVNVLFILLFAGVTVMTVQTLGALLPFALIVTPAAAAVNFSANPKLIITLSVTISAVCTVFGVVLAVIFGLPTSFVIVALVFVVWLLSKLFV